MAAIAINTGEILHREELFYPDYNPSTNFFSTVFDQPGVVGVIGSKEAIEETSRLMESRAHLQELRVELERRERRLQR
jgi:hypothetical protein